MADLTIIRQPAGKIVARDVSEDDYMEHYAAHHHEWVRGYVIRMAPIRLQHNDLIDYLRDLLRIYFVLNPTGRVVGEPFVMRLAAVESRREPDLQVILEANLPNLKDTYMDGPADICIEVVSPSNAAVDYGEKLEEYEQGGVGEYWLFDPQRRAAYFYRQQETGGYLSVSPDADGDYRTPRLPKFALHVPTLWQDELPNVIQITESVRGMLKP
ncbi:MAG: Uma2 family endonuclease [Anaerolineae bacterium]